MQDYGLSLKKAMERNQQTDSDRAAFHRYYTREEWGASADYDLCLDSGIDVYKRQAKEKAEWAYKGRPGSHEIG